MKRAVLAAALFLGAALLSAQEPAGPAEAGQATDAALRAETLNRMAVEAAEESYYTLAAELLRDAVDLRPDRLLYTLNLAEAYKALQRFAEAEETLSRAMALPREEAELQSLRRALAGIRNRQAVLAYNEGDFGKAIELLRQAVEIAPDDAVAAMNLGRLLFGTGSLQEAEEVLAKAATHVSDPEQRLDIRRVQAEIWNRRAVIAANESSYDEAIELVRRALEADPQKVLYVKNLAQVLKSAKKLDAEKPLLRKALAAAVPDGREDLVLLGGSFELVGDFARAADLYSRALAEARAASDREAERKILLDLGYAQDGLGLLQEASDRFAEAQALEPPSRGGAEPDAEGSRRPRLMIQTGNFGSVEQAVFSQDGRWIATAGWDNTVRLWDALSGRELRSLPQHAWAVNGVAFSPDGRYLLTANGNWTGESRIWKSAGGRKSNNVLAGDRTWERTDSVACLWDLETGREVRHFLGHLAMVTAVAFSPDGRIALTGSSDGTVRLWEIATGRGLRRLELPGELTDVAFSPDGRTVAAASEDGSIRQWGIGTGEVLWTSHHSSSVKGLSFLSEGQAIVTRSSAELCLWRSSDGRRLQCFVEDDDREPLALSPDGRLLLARSSEKEILLTVAATGEVAQRWPVPLESTSSPVFSAAGDRIFTADGDQLQIWHVDSGRVQRFFEDYASGLWGMEVLPGQLVLLSGGNTVHLWDLAGSRRVSRRVESTTREDGEGLLGLDENLLLTFEDGTLTAQDIATGETVRSFSIPRKPETDEERQRAPLSIDGRFVLLSGTEPSGTRLLDTRTGQEIPLETGEDGPGELLAISPDARKALTQCGEESFCLQSLDGAGQLWIWEWSSHLQSARFSADGSQVLVGDLDGVALLLDTASGKLLQRLTGHIDLIRAVDLSADGRFALTAGNDRVALLFDRKTGRQLHRLEGHLAALTSARFSPDNRFVFTASNDATVRVWDVETGVELCRLVSFESAAWAVVDREGRYDASSAGDIEGLHWVVGNEAISLSQLKQRYYDPGLLAKILGFSKEPLRQVSTFREVLLFPSVEFSVPPAGSTRMRIHLANRGGGLGRVQVFVNNREVVADGRKPGLDPRAAAVELEVDLSGASVLPGVANRVEVVVWNVENYLSSRRILQEWFPAGKPQENEIPEVYAIIAGISDYASPALALSFAAKDASDMARAFELGARRLFGVDRVHLTLLTTLPVPGALPPTKESFRKAFEEARQASPEDILLVYLAGHGITLPDGSDTYCYLTQAAVTRELVDPELVAQTAITSDELAEWARQVPALKQVMILDTCAAGAAAARLMEKRIPSSDQIRAIERLKDRTGLHILMGSNADAVSYEATQFGQGLLTYSLLQGMKGAALRDGEYVDVARLFQYATDSVPQLARHIGGVQRPEIAAPKGTSFDIGLLTQEDRAAIPLARSRPLLLRPILIDPGMGFDHLDLTNLLKKRLQQDSYAEGRDGRGTAIFVDADELPGAIRPSGIYSIEGKKTRVDLSLIAGGRKLTSFRIEEEGLSLVDLVAKLAESIAAELVRIGPLPDAAESGEPPR